MFLRILKIILSVCFCVFISWSVVVAWTWLIASDGDPLTFTKWNELVAYVDSKISSGINLWTGEGIYAWTGWLTTANFKSLNAGTGIVLSSDADEITISSNGVWAIPSISSETVAVDPGTCSMSTTPYKSFMNAFVSIVSGWTWVEFTPVWTIDPDNNSTNDANMIDNNYTNLVYNNSNQWSANKSLPAIDLGSSQVVWTVRLHWWNPQTYGTTNWTIQWSNNGTTWTNLATWIVKNSWATWDTTDHSVSGSWRYLRFFNVTWQNVNWVVLSETEAFGSGSWTSINHHVFNREIEIRENGWNIQVCNNEWDSYKIEIFSLQ